MVSIKKLQLIYKASNMLHESSLCQERYFIFGLVCRISKEKRGKVKNSIRLTIINPAVVETTFLNYLGSKQTFTSPESGLSGWVCMCVYHHKCLRLYSSKKSNDFDAIFFYLKKCVGVSVVSHS